LIYDAPRAKKAEEECPVDKLLGGTFLIFKNSFCSTLPITKKQQALFFAKTACNF